MIQGRCLRGSVYGWIWLAVPGLWKPHLGPPLAGGLGVLEQRNAPGITRVPLSSPLHGSAGRTPEEVVTGMKWRRGGNRDLKGLDAGGGCRRRDVCPYNRQDSG
ncbi:hypothetical protein DPEC_G00031460 [Dallia pectoralis]|uniref:Uncharacterized protein n=1 Tax=Dallia pectoralis TaxID=75939 RepID=A0ACC2HC73_DALPE|nr:hypothetical protein DPEC_G00031460 [Dallia pectoralis]